MSGAHVHARIYAFCTLCRRLHSISSTQTNTLTYTRHHTVANTVTHAPFTYRHEFWSSPRLAGFVSQATMLYKCLLDISTRFRPLEPSPAMSSLFECLSAVQRQFKLSFVRQLLICIKCILISILMYFVQIAYDSPIFGPLEAYAHLA